MLGRIYKEVKGLDPVDITDYVQKLEQKNQVLLNLQRFDPNDRKFWANVKTAIVEDSGWGELIDLIN